MRSLAPALLLFAACAVHKTHAIVRPASQGTIQPGELTPIPPFAIAEPEDAIVRVVAPSATCSGTLIGEKDTAESELVLTAHHCVVMRGSHGEFSKTEVRPQDLEVELGGSYLPWGTIGVREIVAPPCGHAGGAGDIAVLVLDRKLVGITPMIPRLEQPPKPSETLDVAGFGRCILSPDGIHRALRDGGPVSALSAGTLSLHAQICPGDSGGPVFDRGALGNVKEKKEKPQAYVVGVVSESAMDADEHTSGATVVVRVDAYRDVFNHARLIVDGMPKNTIPPAECPK